MPRLITGAPGQRKFWHGYVDGTHLAVQFGKLGKPGDKQVKVFATAAQATSELAKLVKQKLAKGYVDGAFKLAIPGGPLVLVGVDDLPPNLDAMDADTEELVGEEGWLGLRWRGDYALGLEKRGGKYITGLVDRSSGKVVWRPFKPPIPAPATLTEWDVDMGASLAWAFDSTCKRFIIAEGAVAHVIDCKSGKRTTLPTGDEILSVAFVGDFAAALRTGAKANPLELYRHDGAWVLVKTLPCARHDAIQTFAAGNGLITTSETSGTTYLGFKNGDVRVLGKSDGAFNGYTFEKDGRSYFFHDQGFGEVLEIMHIGDAFNAAFR
jgi:predicted DNA-binding WGR domain protein